MRTTVGESKRVRQARGRAGLLVLASSALVFLTACSTTTPGRAVAATTQTSSSSTSTTTTSTTTTSTTTTESSTSTSSSTTQSQSSTSSSGDSEFSFDGELFTTGKPSLVAVSPDGFLVATNPTGQICIEELFETGIYPDGKICPIDLPDDATVVFPVFSPDGKYLAVVVTVEKSTVWLVNVDTQETSVVTAEGLSTDPAKAEQMNLSSAVWDAAGEAFYTLQSTTAETGALDARYVDGSAPQQIRGIPAEVANSYPQLWSSESGVAIAPNVGANVGELWYLDFGTADTTSVGRYAGEGETLLLQTVSPSGGYALICTAQGEKIGALQRVDLSNGDVIDLFDTCVGAVFSPDSEFLAVGGVVGAGYWLTIYPLGEDSIAFDLELGSDEPAAPPVLTWFDDVVTVTRVDADAGNKQINIVELTKK